MCSDGGGGVDGVGDGMVMFVMVDFGDADGDDGVMVVVMEVRNGDGVVRVMVVMGWWW